MTALLLRPPPPPWSKLCQSLEPLRAVAQASLSWYVVALHGHFQLFVYLINAFQLVVYFFIFYSVFHLFIHSFILLIHSFTHSLTVINIRENKRWKLSLMCNISS